MKLLVATKNKGKFAEIKRMLSNNNLEIISQLEAGIDIEVEENGKSFEENARLKAKALSSLVNLPVLADDSGLEVRALGGRPGVYSARYAGEGAGDDDRINKLLEELNKTGKSDRSARFVCAVLVIFPDGTEIAATGTVEGVIINEKRGNNGFGFDPVFYIPSLKKTFAELTENQKDELSHRARALEKIKLELEKHLF